MVKQAGDVTPGLFLSLMFPYKETNFTFILFLYCLMDVKFSVLFLEDARIFLNALDAKTRTKILYNIDKARVLNDPKLFKKLTDTIWEFRTRYNGLQYRLLAFWDKRDDMETVVISTHGFVKKTDKVPGNELVRAEKLRQDYFEL